MSPGSIWESRRALYLVRGYDDRERHAEGLEVSWPQRTLSASLVRSFRKSLRALGFAHQVEGLAVVLQDGPVGVVLADRRVDLEPAGQLHEELDVFALVQASWRIPAPLLSRRPRTRRRTCSPAGRSGS